MTGQELKILFREDRAYLTEYIALTFKQLGLPDIANTFKEPAFWTIRVLAYSENEKKIFCEITSYQLGEAEFGNSQKYLSNKLNSIQTITFKSIDTARLLKNLAGKSAVVKPIKFVPVEKTTKHSKEFIREPLKVTIKETFYVPLKNVRFKLGGVSFDKKFKQYEKILELTIPNDNIREEFDAVKNYFANVLNTKKIEVKVIVEITDKKVTSIEAKSPEIDKIDNKLIDNVKFEFVKSVTNKKINVQVDKTLFTMDEYFDTFADNNFKSNTFHIDYKDLFEDLLTISGTKHYKHLRFLSSKHSHKIMKLRFIHKPFSFIFLIEGDRKYHIIWETLDTEEATYVWHITKEINILKLTLKKIENIINLIKVQGKTAYINSTDDPFRRIYHDYSDLVDGFVKWKGELESILT